MEYKIRNTAISDAEEKEKHPSPPPSVVESFAKFGHRTDQQHAYMQAAIRNNDGLLEAMGLSPDEIERRIRAGLELENG